MNTVLPVCICQDYQDIREKDGNQSDQAKRFLPEHPSVLVFQPLEEELPKGIDRGLAGEAVVNVLIVGVCFEPEFPGVVKEQNTEEQEENDKSKRGLHICLQFGELNG